MLRTVHTLARRLDTYYIRLLCRQGVLMKISIDSLSLYTSASATAQIKHVFWKCVGDACEMSLFFYWKTNVALRADLDCWTPASWLVSVASWPKSRELIIS